ncbi:HU family DNA-binding protein [Caulobacter sp. SL161]|uniref:HU family DNA-binding protein n=1 Tax=Caulobacter sp. SL161 TaxID=2995156 RepID=UPI002274C8BA|nr:HU family DNA-binding protein [Caulobacter sp. SL161]MCY1646626.1 HU family DNA-binding protein [Caulobacter sp. SL161]
MRVDGHFVQSFMDFSRAWDREVGDIIVQSLVRRMRLALLDGQNLQLPGIGELILHQKGNYALINPTNGQAQALGGERTILFRPDRQLIRELNDFRKETDVT